MVGRLSAQKTGSYYVMYIRTPAFAVQRVDGAGCQPTIPEGQIKPMNQLYILTNGSQGLWSNRGRVMGRRDLCSLEVAAQTPILLGPVGEMSLDQ